MFTRVAVFLCKCALRGDGSGARGGATLGEEEARREGAVSLFSSSLFLFLKIIICFISCFIARPSALLRRPHRLLCAGASRRRVCSFVVMLTVGFGCYFISLIRFLYFYYPRRWARGPRPAPRCRPSARGRRTPNPTQPTQTQITKNNKQTH